MFSNDALLKKISESDKTETITVTEFTWAVSRILNLIKQQKKSLFIRRRGEVIATISPGMNPKE